MKKLFALLFIVANFSFLSPAQGLKDKTFQTWGMSAYTDFFASPVKRVSFYDPNYYNYTTGVYGEQITQYNQNMGFALMTMIYRVRFNLHEFSDNLALTAGLTPAIGLFFSDNGFGGLNLPIMVGIEGGAGSTYNSTANHGTFFNVGVELNKAPVFAGENTDPIYESTTFWVQPVVSAGFRYWNKNNKLREINLKYGFGAGSDAVPVSYSNNNDTGNSFMKPMTIRLSFLYFINY